MPVGLPVALLALHDGILGGRGVDEVGHPGVPAWFDLRATVRNISTELVDLPRREERPNKRWPARSHVRFKLLLLIIHPSRPQRQLLSQILVVLVSEPVGADERAGFGVAWEVGREG